MHQQRQGLHLGTGGPAIIANCPLDVRARPDLAVSFLLVAGVFHGMH